jgi:hypothetical protein
MRWWAARLIKPSLYFLLAFVF